MKTENVDTTKTTTHVSLCAGYGGIDLGLGRAIPNLRTIAFSEIEAFACANLVAKMEAGLLDAAPIWTNLKTFPWSDFRDRVDILSGGYPCQPFSAAGKRLGRDDPRHLWPWIADGIVSMRPRVCFFENVEGHISLGLREVISELEGLGYATTWGVFSAREVGAPHQRKRVFILAYRKSEGLERYNGLFAGCGESRRDASEQKGQASWGNSGGNTWPSRPGQPQHGWEPPRVVVNSEIKRAGIRSQFCESDGGQGQALPCQSDESDRIVGNAKGWSYGQQPTEQQGRDTSGRSGEESGANNELSQAQPSLGGDFDGSSYRMDNAELFVTSDNRTDELRLLGNGVVPATATRAFLTLMDQLLNETP